MCYGKMVACRYLPKECLPASWDDLSVEEFLELYGKADCARELGIDDLAAGFVKAFGKLFEE